MNKQELIMVRKVEDFLHRINPKTLKVLKEIFPTEKERGEWLKIICKIKIQDPPSTQDEIRHFKDYVGAISLQESNNKKRRSPLSIQRNSIKKTISANSPGEYNKQLLRTGKKLQKVVGHLDIVDHSQELKELERKRSLITTHNNRREIQTFEELDYDELNKVYKQLEILDTLFADLDRICDLLTIKKREPSKGEFIYPIAKEFVQNLHNEKFKTNSEVLAALKEMEKNFTWDDRPFLKSDGRHIKSKIYEALAQIYSLKMEGDADKTIDPTTIRDTFIDRNLKI